MHCLVDLEVTERALSPAMKFRRLTSVKAAHALISESLQILSHSAACPSSSNLSLMPCLAVRNLFRPSEVPSLGEPEPAPAAAERLRP